MIEIKICGITNTADALAAYEAGADAVGFIFYPQSPRYVLPEQAARMIRELPPDLCKVGVFVNTDLLNLKEIVSYSGIDLIQLHGNESPDFCKQLPAAQVIKSLAPNNREDLQEADAYQVRALLIDAPRDPQNFQYGGTGKTADWNMAVALKSRGPLILAGGLKAENAADAAAFVVPDAVDFNSGVEIHPRKKDPEKIKQVIEIVRRADPDIGNKREKIFSRIQA